MGMLKNNLHITGFAYFTVLYDGKHHNSLCLLITQEWAAYKNCKNQMKKKTTTKKHSTSIILKYLGLKAMLQAAIDPTCLVSE